MWPFDERFTLKGVSRELGVAHTTTAVWLADVGIFVSDVPAISRTDLEERMAAGPAWIETVYVFTREDGQPPHPGWVTKRWNDAVAAAGVPPIRLHDARHSAASIMLRAKVPTKVVSERLGHANVGITLSVYAHITAQDDQAAADALGVALGEV